MSAPRVDSQQQRLTPEQEAVSLYNDGISYRDKAAKFEKEAAAEPDRDQGDDQRRAKHGDGDEVVMIDGGWGMHRI